tara:strand:- start:542 stop:751 length:210 start_codon:yes stop_codon:yes gene_type:complete
MITVELTREEVQSISEAFNFFWSSGGVKSPQLGVGLISSASKLQQAWDAVASENGNGSAEGAEEIAINR